MSPIICDVLLENPAYEAAYDAFLDHPLSCSYIQRLFLYCAQSGKRCSYVTHSIGSDQTPHRTRGVCSETVLLFPP